MKVLIAILVLVQCGFAQPYWKAFYTGAPGPVVGIAMTSTGDIFVATQHEGLLKSYNNLVSWETDTVSNSFYEAYDVVVNDNNELFMCADKTFLAWRSLDTGATWDPIGKDLGYPIAFDLTITPDQSIFAATYRRRILRSVDNGDNWVEIGPENIPTLTHIQATVDGDVYASDGVSLFRSTDNGDTWDDLTYKVPDRNFLSISAGASGTVYVGAYGPDGHILASSDRGETWREMRTINLDIHVVGVVEMDNGDLIAATEDYLVWRSTDGGDTWSGFWDGLNQSPTCIYQSRNGRVFLGASGAIYELMGYPVSTGALPAPASLSLAQSYPNPVSTGQSAYINFSLPSQQHVTLTVYNTSGQEVATLAQGTYQPGTHTAQCTTAGLPAGVYVYRLIAGDMQESKLMQVVR